MSVPAVLARLLLNLVVGRPRGLARRDASLGVNATLNRRRARAGMPATSLGRSRATHPVSLATRLQPESETVIGWVGVSAEVSEPVCGCARTGGGREGLFEALLEAFAESELGADVDGGCVGPVAVDGGFEDVAAGVVAVDRRRRRGCCGRRGSSRRRGPRPSMGPSTTRRLWSTVRLGRRARFARSRVQPTLTRSSAGRRRGPSRSDHRRPLPSPVQIAVTVHWARLRTMTPRSVRRSRSLARVTISSPT